MEEGSRSTLGGRCGGRWEEGGGGREREGGRGGEREREREGEGERGRTEREGGLERERVDFYSRVCVSGEEEEEVGSTFFSWSGERESISSRGEGRGARGGGGSMSNSGGERGEVSSNFDLGVNKLSFGGLRVCNLYLEGQFYFGSTDTEPSSTEDTRLPMRRQTQYLPFEKTDRLRDR